jgi:hypothetical protein
MVLNMLVKMNMFIDFKLLQNGMCSFHCAVHACHQSSCVEKVETTYAKQPTTIEKVRELKYLIVT